MAARNFYASILTVLLAVVTVDARAQIPVTDIGAIVQLVVQVQTIEQELETARNNLAQAQQAYQSMTGSRGMENLLGGVVRNYLPADLAQLQSAVSGAANAYGSLTTSIQTAIAANSVLSAGDLAALSPAERAAIQARRQSVALLQGLTQQALTTTSNRFASIQQLIAAISGATDPKGILELQARIQAEQGMLQNEQTKLTVLYQAAVAQEWAERQRTREQAVADGGSLRRLPPMGL